MHEKRSQLKQGISAGFSFLLSLLLFFGCVLLVIQSTVLNPDYMRGKLGESHYYERAIDETEDEFSSYASASGFDEKFFKTVLDVNDVQLNVNRSLSVLYGESDQPADPTEFESSLYQKLLDNVKSRGTPVSASTGASLQLLAKTCSDTYIQYVSIPYVSVFAPIIKKLRAPLLAADVLILLLILLFAAAIFRISHWRHRALRAYIYAAVGAALMLAAFPAAVLLSGGIDRIALLSESMHAFAVCYLNGIFYSLLLCALLLGMGGLVLSWPYLVLKRKAVSGDGKE